MHKVYITLPYTNQEHNIECVHSAFSVQLSQVLYIRTYIHMYVCTCMCTASVVRDQAGLRNTIVSS